MHNSAQIDYTYCNYASGVTSTIDHFLLTERAHKLIVNVQVAHSGANLSGRDPLLLQMRIPHQKLKESIQRGSMNVQWNKATECDLNAYREDIASSLSNITDLSSVQCDNVLCMIAI